MSVDAPDEVLEVVLGLPGTDNPRVYSEILEVALQLHGERSGKLVAKMLEYARLEHQFHEHRYGDLLAHWVEEGQAPAALALLEVLVRFEPDPRFEEKREERRKDPDGAGGLLATILKPSPQMDDWEFERMLEKGARPLAERESYRVAHILIDATANMSDLQTHQDDLENGSREDHSWIWAKRLDGFGGSYPDSKRALAQTMAFACRKVFEKDPGSIADLNEYLRGQRWGIFDRLRQHLYTLHLDDQTLPWVRELIVEYGR